MAEDVRETLEYIRSMTRKYRSIPGANAATANSLLDETDLLRQKIEQGLAAFAVSEEKDPLLLKELGEALQEAREASIEAELYLQREMQDLRQTLGTIRIGNKARRAYQTPRIGMGYTEGSFVDRRR